MACNPLLPPIPASEAELRATFGDIRKYIRSDGTLNPSWEAEQIVRIMLPGPIPYAYGPKPITKVTVHRKLATGAKLLFAAIWERELVTALVDYSGGFNFRPNRNNAAVLSLHAYGLAWDFGASAFPNGSKKRRNAELVQTFAEFGFRCGQDFKGTPDPQHFSYATGAIG